MQYMVRWIKGFHAIAMISEKGLQNFVLYEYDNICMMKDMSVNFLVLNYIYSPIPIPQNLYQTNNDMISC
jgi:hypothetical protein